MPEYVGVLFMAVPALILGVFVAIFVIQRRMARAVATVPPGWIAATGWVTDEIAGMQRRDYGGDIDYVYVRQPIVTYRPGSGGEITFTSSITGTFMPKPGATVGVYYDPHDPSRARIAPESIPKLAGRLSAVVWVLIGVFLVPFVIGLEVIGYLLLR